MAAVQVYDTEVVTVPAYVPGPRVHVYDIEVVSLPEVVPTTPHVRVYDIRIVQGLGNQPGDGESFIKFNGQWQPYETLVRWQGAWR